MQGRIKGLGDRAIDGGAYSRGRATFQGRIQNGEGEGIQLYRGLYKFGGIKLLPGAYTKGGGRGGVNVLETEKETYK